MRGFVIAVDALVSLAVLFVIITLAFDAASSADTSLRQENALRVFAEHAALTLEQSQLLARSVILNNTTSIRTYINGWPLSICGSVTVFPSPDVNTPTFIVTKSGCTLNSAQTEIVRHSFMVPSPPDVNMYVMEVSTWPGSP
ncbi:MAG: hypothetical protein FJY86_02295 [Candidatus Diapherotrites archaeon]|uniref:Uncharacterized protein n=1 Tax=Candidatus Iainarchaeum sp. TaxID=3101447 RepID=A0A8T4CB19_9ARCH|nr:hypothetical protein [Candidatus Diapherotrites archaeon]